MEKENRSRFLDMLDGKSEQRQRKEKFLDGKNDKKQLTTFKKKSLTDKHYEPQVLNYLYSRQD